MRPAIALLVVASTAVAQPAKPEDPPALFAQLRSKIADVQFQVAVGRSEKSFRARGASPPPVDWITPIEANLRNATDVAHRLSGAKDQPGFPSFEQIRSLSADLAEAPIAELVADHLRDLGEPAIRAVMVKAALAALKTSLATLSGAARSNSYRHVPMPGPVSDRWWLDSATAKALELTPDQVARIEDVYTRHRPALAEPASALEREEYQLTATLAEAKFDHAKANEQLDRVAQARAELEKARGRMLLDIRDILLPRQWRALGESTKKE